MNYPIHKIPAAHWPSVAFFTDPECKHRADVFDSPNHQYPHNEVTVATQRTIPHFLARDAETGQAVTTKLYAKSADGKRVWALDPEPQPPHTNAVVTGTKGSDSALASLISVLAQLGIIVDGTE